MPQSSDYSLSLVSIHLAIHSFRQGIYSQMVYHILDDFTLRLTWMGRCQSECIHVNSISKSTTKLLVSALRMGPNQKKWLAFNCSRTGEDEYETLVDVKRVHFLKPSATLLYNHLSWQQQPFPISL